MRDFIRLIILIVLLPILILLIGPLLVLAAIRGHQQVGPITLDSSRYQAGMMLFLGLVLWLLIWGGLGWLVFGNAGAEPAVVDVLPSVTTSGEAALEAPVDEPAAVASAEPAAITPVPSPTTGALTRTPTATPAEDSGDTPTPAREPVVTRPAAAAQSTPLPDEADVPEPVLLPADRQAVLRALDDANDLLREAIIQGDAESVADLSRLWKGSALASIERFSRQAHRRFAQPVVVEYEYISPSTFGEQERTDQVVVTAREKWRYESPADSEEESFLFEYTLVPKDEGWVITRYTFQNLARLTVTPAAGPDEAPPETATP